MEGFRSPSGLTPLELEDSIRTVRHASNGPQKELSGPLWGVLGTPLDCTGGLLHEQPGSTIAEAAHDVTLPCDVVCSLRICGVRVGIISDDVTQWCPLAVVEKREGPHKIRRDWSVRIATNHFSFTFHLGTQSVVTKATPIQHLRGVVESRHRTRGLNLRNIGVSLGPKCRSPGVIDRFDSAVALQQPLTESVRRFLVEALRRVTSVFVRNVPHDDAGMVTKTACHGLGQRAGLLGEERPGRVVLLARSKAQAHASRIDGKSLGIALRHPGRRGSSPIGQIHANAGIVELVNEVC